MLCPFIGTGARCNYATEWWQLGGAVASASTFLERLCASFLIDAKGFFDFAIYFGWSFPNLKYVTLTTEQLQHLNVRDRHQKKLYEEHLAAVNLLLRKAATVADRMPQLQEMEIWNGAAGTAGMFQYIKGDRAARLVWRGTCELPLDEATVDHWRQVARHHTGYEFVTLTLDYELIDPAWVTCHVGAMCILGVSGHALHWQSRIQVLNEGNFCFYP